MSQDPADSVAPMHAATFGAVRDAYVRLFGVEPNPPSVEAMLPAGYDAEATGTRIHNLHLLVHWTLDDALENGTLGKKLQTEGDGD